MKKTIRFLLNTITCFVTIVGVLTIALYLLGIRPTVVTSGSMIPAIGIGDVCFINTRYPYEKVQKQDIIVYKEPRQKVIHRVVGKTEEGLITKGDANNNQDRLRITKNEFMGKMVFLVPKVGYISTNLQGATAKAIFVTIIIAIYVAAYLLNYEKKERKKNEYGDNR